MDVFLSSSDLETLCLLQRLLLLGAHGPSHQAGGRPTLLLYLYIYGL